MASPPVKGKGNFLTRKAGPLPVWGYAAILLALYLGYTILKGRGATTNTAATPSTSAADTSGAGAALGGTPSQNSAPGDQLSPDVLQALLGNQGLIGSLGESLANVATNAQNQLGYISATTTLGSFQLANQAVQSNTELATQAMANTGQATIVYQTQPSTPPIAPPPSNTPAPYAPSSGNQPLYGGTLTVPGLSSVPPEIQAQIPQSVSGSYQLTPQTIHPSAPSSANYGGTTKITPAQTSARNARNAA